jgi:hypothetical protein
MKKISLMTKSLIAVAILGVCTFYGGMAHADLGCSGVNCAKIGANNVSNNQVGNLQGTINSIINVVIYVIGFVAVAMVIVGGVQYSTSTGDATKVKNAKNTIMYGIIGLIIAILAFAIVNFVLTGIF